MTVSTLTLRQTKGARLTTVEMDNNWLYCSDSSNATFAQSGIAAANRATRTVQAKEGDILCVLDAKNDDGTAVAGNGTQDDTTGIAAAIASGKRILFPSGYTFLTSGFTVSTAGQMIEAWGATIKLKSASSTPICKLNAAGCAVYGGTWDANNVAQAAIYLNADYCAAQFATVQNCGAAGIYGSNNANYLTVANNVVKDAITYGIYVEGTTVDTTGNKIVDNVVDVSASTVAYGIYLTGSNSPYTFKQRRWNVSRNVVKGTSNGGATTVGITVRGVEGVYQGNQVTGFLLQHSLDITDSSTITGNRGTDPASSGTTYGLEVNGAHNTITGNFMKGHGYGIVGTGSVTMDYNVVSGNVIQNAKTFGIYFNPTGGVTATYLNITGNVVDMSAASSGLQLIYLTNDCSHASIVGNTLLGRGSATANTRGVFFDTQNAAVYAKIIGNTFSGLERACTVYNGGVVTHTDLYASDNDTSNDVASLTNFFNAEGSAVLGSNIVIGLFPVVGKQQYNDRGSNIFEYRDTSNNTPEGNTTAGIASIEISQNTGHLWIKRAGTGNTGWREVFTNDVAADVGNAGVTLTAGSSSPTQVYNTAITADRAVALSTTGAYNGAKFRIVRTASCTGAFNVNVGTGPLKAMATPGSFCDVEYNGNTSAWMLTGYGVL